MKLESLNNIYNKLQIKYGDKNFDVIYSDELFDRLDMLFLSV